MTSLIEELVNRGEVIMSMYNAYKQLTSDEMSDDEVYKIMDDYFYDTCTFADAKAKSMIFGKLKKMLDEYNINPLLFKYADLDLEELEPIVEDMLHRYKEEFYDKITYCGVLLTVYYLERGIQDDVSLMIINKMVSLF